MSNNGYLVISLDFELIWGVFDVVDLKTKEHYFLNTLKVIPQVLKLFKENEIHATWASVGMLFNKDWDEWDKNIPKLVPEYEKESLSAYNYGRSNPNNNLDNIFFAPSLIEQIIVTEGQEMGTHTYSHYYCQENHQTLEQFEQDLIKAITIAEKFNVKLKSLVFPRNQLKKEYLKICRDLGILNVRSNPSNWYWKDPKATSLFTKIARTADAYINLGNKCYDLEDIKSNNSYPLEHPASRFLRPFETNSNLRKLKLKRIKMEMTYAAKNNKVYHLWWHPHNFGDNPKESMIDLKDILNHFKFLQDKYNFTSLNMQELGEIILKK